MMSQEADVAGMVRIRCSNLVTCARVQVYILSLWLLGCLILALQNLQHKLVSPCISIHQNPMFLYTTIVENASIGIFFISV